MGGAQANFHPLLPLQLPLRLFPPPSPPSPLPSPAAHAFTCGLPRAGAPGAAAPHGVGWGTDAWADHHASRTAETPRGHRLFAQRWLPRGRAVGVVHVVHGLGDHSGKYARLARELVAAGYAVVAHDAHGHGRSDGIRGHADSVMDYVDDARRAIAHASARLPHRYAGLPHVLLGHSLGGAVAIHLAKGAHRREWAGVVLTAPAVAVYPSPLLKLFAPVLATLAPLMRVQRLGRPRAARAEGAEGARVRPQAPRDPLVVRAPVRAKLGYEVLKSCESIMRGAAGFTLPVFVAHSRGDRVTNAQGSVVFTERIGSKDKTLMLYDGRAHDLLCDGRRRRVVRDVVRWADERCATWVEEEEVRRGKRSKRWRWRLFKKQAA